MEDDTNKSIENITKDMSELTVLSFRKLDEVKRLAKHFQFVVNHPLTQANPVVLRYLKNLDEKHKEIFLMKREDVHVEYIFTTEKKSSLQRQRFNSLPVSDVPELLKAEFQTIDNAKQVHICTDCDIEIELCDDVPLMESLQKHFSLEAHLPKLKRESIDVAEPIQLPKMSRRLSALESGDNQNMEQIFQMLKPAVKMDDLFVALLESYLIKFLPVKTEESIDAAMKFYEEVYEQLCINISAIDFSTQTSSVAPIIMSIRDNVNQNFAVDANKNYENEENEHTPDKPMKNQVKKYRYYGPIENTIVKFLLHHKLLTLIDDRTGKLAFFCIPCEYYTLRFRYDSVLNHVFSETHIHNLACIMQADKNIEFSTSLFTIDKIKETNKDFLLHHYIVYDNNGPSCILCKVTLDNESIILHILDENHLAKVSDKAFRTMKKPDGSVPEDWGPKSLDWTKFLASSGKPLYNRDHVVIENFIKPSGKIANYCSCCDMTLKGPRQVLFNHIRQKKHLRNAAPHKLTMLYKNYCRPAEYFASFGNHYICTICPKYVTLPSFAAIVEHFECDMHIKTVAKYIRSGLYDVNEDLFNTNKITIGDVFKCEFCDVVFNTSKEAVKHILSNVEHQNALADERVRLNKGDIISVYMHGNYILHSDGATFTCVPCKGVFNSIRSLLMHLVYAEHFTGRPTTENVFRFYLELKHNINMLARNKYVYYEFGKLKCGVCDADLDEGENAKKHVVSPRHKENMGASYVNINLDVSAME